MKRLNILSLTIISLALTSMVFAAAGRVPGGSSGSIGSRTFTANADGSQITVHRPGNTPMVFEYWPPWGYCMEAGVKKDADICLEIENTEDKDKTNDVATFVYYEPPPPVGPVNANGTTFGTARVRYN